MEELTLDKYYAGIIVNCDLHRIIHNYNFSRLNNDLVYKPHTVLDILSCLEQLAELDSELINIIKFYKKISVTSNNDEKQKLILLFIFLQIINDYVCRGSPKSSFNQSHIGDVEYIDAYNNIYNLKEIAYEILVNELYCDYGDVWPDFEYQIEIRMDTLFENCEKRYSCCCKPNLNYEFVFEKPYELRIQRLDLIEKILFGTKTTMYYATDVHLALNKLIKDIVCDSIEGKIIDLFSLDKNNIKKALNYFQDTNLSKLYYLNGKLIDSKSNIFFKSNEKDLNIGIIFTPETCFVCDKYNHKITYKIDAEGNSYSKIITEEKVENYLCTKCGEDIIKKINLEKRTYTISYKVNKKETQSPTNLVNKNPHIKFVSKKETLVGPQGNYAYNKKSNTFVQQCIIPGEKFPSTYLINLRIQKPILILVTFLFDLTSFFYTIPKELIVEIIFWFYWDISSCLYDISDTKIIHNKKQIYYSEFRHNDQILF